MSEQRRPDEMIFTRADGTRYRLVGERGPEMVPLPPRMTTSLVSSIFYVTTTLQVRDEPT